jgi:ornithine cyclodeaminase/alanine dehydrogenase-like protein (mu-crystallin family)
VRRRKLVKRIETSPTWTMEHNLLRDLILNQEKERVKLNKVIFVKGKTVNGDELFMSMWNVKDIIEVKWSNRSGYN